MYVQLYITPTFFEFLGDSSGYSRINNNNHTIRSYALYLYAHYRYQPLKHSQPGASLPLQSQMFHGRMQRTRSFGFKTKQWLLTSWLEVVVRQYQDASRTGS
uniref:Uncharacterized protein n=1 Tax=Bionectria ochroleuca TaxID=29856 RepID=A0A8H7NIN9_BIOOC